ncbi:hypothetical protein ACFQMA_21760 [Halosimplex aquaticum]|uniref:PEP-CTERM protein-sorting domain-containing protein n=1 Tax=Halosimplex aquaticum TaxID=3026162 RepID=A0ABD5Y9Q0_9EURY|nr:hypothetical protein [Halosimplex aquaticum]
MGYGSKLVQRVPLFFLLMGLAAFGMGRKASRTNAGGEIPDWVGFLLIGGAVALWVVINVVVGVGSE